MVQRSQTTRSCAGAGREAERSGRRLARSRPGSRLGAEETEGRLARAPLKEGERHAGASLDRRGEGLGMLLHPRLDQPGVTSHVPGAARAEVSEGRHFRRCRAGGARDVKQLRVDVAEPALAERPLEDDGVEQDFQHLLELEALHVQLLECYLLTVHVSLCAEGRPSYSVRQRDEKEGDFAPGGCEVTDLLRRRRQLSCR